MPAQPLHITLAGRELVVDAGATAGAALQISNGTASPGAGSAGSG